MNEIRIIIGLIVIVLIYFIYRWSIKDTKAEKEIQNIINQGSVKGQWEQ